MKLNSEELTMPARPAATVVLLRDGAAGLEVFLIKRHGLSDVLGGACVFPGGKVDADDALLDMATHLDQLPAQLHQALGEPALATLDAAGLYVAAMRETFEESGILFVQDAGQALADQAHGLLREGLHFDEMLSQLGLRLAASGLVPWSRWITPRVASVTNKRFDTRFFVAALPGKQQARHADHEATESLWLTPRDALQRYWDGHIELAPPQIMSLAHLSRHASAADVLGQARRRAPPVIQPEPFDDEGTRVVCYPGDARHSVREHALPGPTRLHWRNKRFEPAGGLAELLG